MKQKHPYWTLAEKENKTDTDRIALTGIVRLSTTKEYENLTQEDIYDFLLKHSYEFIK